MWSTLLGKKKKKPERAKTTRSVKQAFGPPLTKEEQGINLTVLEKDLNEKAKCPAARNQVYIRSLVTGSGTTQPRIALKCSFRKDSGMDPEVFYEHIRDVCCSDPEKCQAFRDFKDRSGM